MRFTNLLFSFSLESGKASDYCLFWHIPTVDSFLVTTALIASIDGWGNILELLDAYSIENFMYIFVRWILICAKLAEKAFHANISRFSFSCFPGRLDLFHECLKRLIFTLGGFVLLDCNRFCYQRRTSDNLKVPIRAVIALSRYLSYFS